jgi:hypothetical protein
MKDENLKSNPEDSSVNNGEVPEVKAVPVDDSLQQEIVSNDPVGEDDVIVYLDDDVDFCETEDAPELLSHRPGEEDVLSEFERLPEVQAELVEEIPEVLSVEDVTSLVSEEIETDWSDFIADQMVAMEKFRDYVTMHRKWFAGAAAVLLLIVIAVMIPGGTDSGNGVASSEVNATAEAFDQWVGQALTGHLSEIGEK